MSTFNPFKEPCKGDGKTTIIDKSGEKLSKQEAFLSTRKKEKYYLVMSRGVCAKSRTTIDAVVNVIELYALVVLMFVMENIPISIVIVYKNKMFMF